MFNRIDKIANMYATSEQYFKIPYIVVYAKFDKKRKDFLYLSSDIFNENGYRHFLSDYSFYKKRSNI